MSPGNAPILWRHNSVVQVLAASRSPSIELQLMGAGRRRPGVSAVGAHGGRDHFYVTISYPLSASPSTLDKNARCPTALLSSAASRKRTKYHTFVADEGPDTRIIPVASLGGWDRRAYAYFIEVYKTIAPNSQMPRRFVNSIVVRCIAARIAELHSRCLTKGIHHGL